MKRRYDAIKTALVTMFNKLIFSRKLLLKPLLERIRNTSSDENVRRMQELQQLLEGITGKKNTLRQLRAQGIIDTVILRAACTEDKLSLLSVDEQLYLLRSAECVQGCLIQYEKVMLQIQCQNHVFILPFYALSSSCSVISSCACVTSDGVTKPSRKSTFVDISCSSTDIP